MQYVNTLQPKYSSIDLTEVELPETEMSSLAHSDIERENENANMLLDVCILFIYTILSVINMYVGTSLTHSLYLTLSFFVLRLLNDSNVFATYNEICVRFCTCFVISHILYVCSPIKSEWIYVFISPFLSFFLLLLVSALVGSRRFAQLCHVVSLNNFQICYTLC